MSSVEIKKLKRKMNWFLVFIVAVYIPFIFFLSFKYSTLDMSLSRIGWREGGMQYLVYYVVATVVLMVFYTYVFLSLSGSKSRLLKVLVLASGLLMTAGSFFPVTPTSPEYSHLLHNTLCQLGALLGLVAVTIMIAMYCKSGRVNVKAAAILYAELLVVIAIAFGILFTAAIFEIVASLLILITMHGMNSTLLKTCQPTTVKHL